MTNHITDKPAWIVAALPYGKLVSTRELPLGTDLIVTLLEEMLRYHRDGAVLQNDGRLTHYFYVVNIHKERLHVYFTGLRPGSPPPRYVGVMQAWAEADAKKRESSGTSE